MTKHYSLQAYCILGILIAVVIASVVEATAKPPVSDQKQDLSATVPMIWDTPACQTRVVGNTVLAVPHSCDRK